MGNPHVLVVPYPAQGHVIPLMELAHSLAQHEFRVTFVNSDFTQDRVTGSSPEKNGFGEDSIRLVSISDGLEPSEDRNELGNLTESIFRVMPAKLEELIMEINGSDGDEVACVIADISMAWVMEVAAKMGIRRAAFCPMSAAMLGLVYNVPKLMEDGIINDDGTPTKNEVIKLTPDMPAMNTANFPWACIGDLATQKKIFDVTLTGRPALDLADRIICNSSSGLEGAVFDQYPQFLPVGPLLRSSGGNFWQEDSTCLDWLDQQPPKSVIYVAFGSFAVFDPTQFRELAKGLELTDRPFLWVVRRDSAVKYPEGFEKIIGTGRRGKIVEWAPQKKVLSHPSVGCFLSHCGWNSTVEAVSNGVPLLCWPYFADQSFNQSYICDVWKVGLGFGKDENGLIIFEEIKKKVDEIFGDENYRERALDLKQKVMDGVKEGGCSNRNFSKIMGWITQINNGLSS